MPNCYNHVKLSYSKGVSSDLRAPDAPCRLAEEPRQSSFWPDRCWPNPDSWCFIRSYKSETLPFSHPESGKWLLVSWEGGKSWHTFLKLPSSKQQREGIRGNAPSLLAWLRTQCSSYVLSNPIAKHIMETSAHTGFRLCDKLFLKKKQRGTRDAIHRIQRKAASFFF